MRRALDAVPVGHWVEVETAVGEVFRLEKVDADHWVEPGDGITLSTADLVDGRVTDLFGEDPHWTEDEEWVQRQLAQAPLTRARLLTTEART